MFDYVFKALEEYALPSCPFCQSKYEGEEQSLTGGVEKWECGTVAAKVDHEWYRSKDCRDQQVRLLVNDNNSLRAEVARLTEDNERLLKAVERRINALEQKSNSLDMAMQSHNNRMDRLVTCSGCDREMHIVCPYCGNGAVGREVTEPKPAPAVAEVTDYQECAKCGGTSIWTDGKTWRCVVCDPKPKISKEEEIIAGIAEFKKYLDRQAESMFGVPDTGERDEELRAEMEEQVQVLLRVRRSLWEDLPDEALHILKDHLTPRGLWEAKEDAQ